MFVEGRDKSLIQKSVVDQYDPDFYASNLVRKCLVVRSVPIRVCLATPRIVTTQTVQTE